MKTVLVFISGKRLGYRGLVNGQRQRDPTTLEKLICRVWNQVYCWMFGHDTVLFQVDEPEREVHCPHCCTVLGFRHDRHD